MPAKEPLPQRLSLLLMALCLAGLASAAWLRETSPTPAQIAYLHPSRGPHNIWLLSLDKPDSPQQLTTSPFGVDSYHVSRDGAQIVYSQRDESGYASLHLLDVPRRQSRQLVDCAASGRECANPRFNPAGDKIAYELDSQIWLIDLAQDPIETTPLINDQGISGHSPVWSADGGVIGFAAIDHGEYGILLYDFRREPPLRFVQTAHGTMGALSPDAALLLFPEVTKRGGQHFSYLRLADLRAKTVSDFSDPNAPINDASARFSPDGARIAIARQYTDDRWTPGPQLYLASIGQGEGDWQPVVHDPGYTTAYARWDAAGENLLLQRFPLDVAAEMAAPEVWRYDMAKDEAELLMLDAFLPQWVGSKL